MVIPKPRMLGTFNFRKGSNSLKNYTFSEAIAIWSQLQSSYLKAWLWGIFQRNLLLMVIYSTDNITDAFNIYLCMRMFNEHNL